MIGEPPLSAGADHVTDICRSPATATSDPGSPGTVTPAVGVNVGVSVGVLVLVGVIVGVDVAVNVGVSVGVDVGV